MSYREELDKVRLTETGKAALTQALCRHMAEKEERRPRRRLMRPWIAAAAVICLLMATAGAAVLASPTLRDRVFGGGPGYDQSSAVMGRSVEQNGWTLTLTDCVGDDRRIYLGIEVTAPEGTVLDREHYAFAQHDVDFPGHDWAGGASLDQLPDDDPTDNRISFVYWSNRILPDGETINGSDIQVSLGDLCWLSWDGAEEKVAWNPVYEGPWDFGTFSLTYQDSTIRLTPELPVTTLGVEAMITQVEVSPLGVYVRIEGDTLKGHHSWVPKNAPDGWYGCMEYQEILLYDAEGNVLTVDGVTSDCSGSGCSGGTDASEDGYLVLARAFDSLVDVDTLTAISVCGVEIALR